MISFTLAMALGVRFTGSAFGAVSGWGCVVTSGVVVVAMGISLKNRVKMG
jgi:hypothetical protein